MKVLLYSHFFYPSIGGIESVSLTLAKAFVQHNIQCKVVTTTNADEPDKFPFNIVRNPTRRQSVEVVRWADVILFNGACLALQPWPLIFRKPFVWVHTGYQVSCIDGLGWVEGERAPITPLSSFLYHFRRNGWKTSLHGSLKLLLKRFFAKYLVSKNIAITDWMLKTQPLPRQLRIYNPFPIDDFISSSKNAVPEYEFLYLGRLVSEKGVATLLRAFSELIRTTNLNPRLLIIGDGNWRTKMEKLAKELQISSLVTFAGKKSGRELVECVSKGNIAIVPSEWFEPMGGVALELMAAGKNLIVSEYGGLKECVGDGALTFPNGDHIALAKCMNKLLHDASLRKVQLNKLKKKIKDFFPHIFVTQYIGLLYKV